MSSINFSDTTPAAPTGGVNLRWQQDGNGNISAYAAKSDITGGLVTSVFGRTGDVVAQSGDYNAGQVLYAVDQRVGYSNPMWLASLDWSKITNVPAFGGGLLNNIFHFGATGDGVTDDSQAFIKAIAAGGAFIPAGFTYLIKQSLAVGPGVTLIGGGPKAVVKRGAALASGHALFDINGSNVLFSNFAIDGGVTVAQGVLYSTLAGAASPYDPMQDVLSLNSSVWIHGDFNQGQVSHIALNSMLIQHTGGYAIVIDARNGDVCDVMIINPTLINNRPHLFGTTAGDLSYGSWTGGIHYQGACDSTHPWSVKGLIVTGGTFRRNTGNCVWGHSYAANYLHENVRITGNYFEDCGLDAIQLAMTSTAHVGGNTGRRIGYVATDDTTQAAPKYLGGHYAVFIDTSGAASADCCDNTAVSAYGGFYDLDGFSYGTFSGNSARVPVSGDAEYSEDQISLWSSPNPCYGVQTGNNYFPAGGTSVTIVGNTFINMAFGAIRLFAARGCHVAANNITHPANASYAPVIIGNFQPASNPGVTVYSANNSITENNIQWSPSAAQAAVQELENWGAGSLPWTGQTNRIAQNRLSGTNVFEFSRAPSSASTTQTVISCEDSGLSAGAPVAIRNTAGALTLITNAVERMRITSAGNVGIGTTAPGSLLQVGSGGSAISLGTADVSAGVWIRNDALNTVFSTNVGAMFLGFGGSASKQIHIGNTNPGVLWVQGNGPSNSLVVAGNGYIGISTNAPSYPLHSAANTGYVGTPPTLTYHSAAPSFGLDIPGNAELVCGWMNASPWPMWIQARSASNTAQALALNPAGGNVGIGTTAPIGQLHLKSAYTSIIWEDPNGSVTAGGKWRWGTGGSGNSFAVQMNTASAGDFTTALTPLFINGSGLVGVGMFSPSYLLHLALDSAAKPSTSAWTIASDARLKRNARPLAGGLDIIRALEVIEAEYNGEDGTPKGARVVSFDAAKVRALIAHAVTSHRGRIAGARTDVLDLNIHEILMHLVLAVQQLAAKGA
jgi:hypothetical protein